MKLIGREAEEEEEAFSVEEKSISCLLGSRESFDILKKLGGSQYWSASTSCLDRTSVDYKDLLL